MGTISHYRIGASCWISLVLIFGQPASAQQVAGGKIKPAVSLPAARSTTPLTKKQYEQAIDSLSEIILRADSANRLLAAESARHIAEIVVLDSTVQAKQTDIAGLERKVENYKGQNLKLDQSNRILIIFNSIVGILLLITLVWFLRNIGRKKGKNVPVDPSKSNGRSGEPGTAGFQQLEQKLIQLERLSKLKDQGALTDEEFNRHKQQVLGSVH